MCYERSYSPSGIYRSRNGLIFGVCRGLAERFNLSVFWVRVLVIAAFIFTGFWPVGAIYLLAALLMRREPAYAYAKTETTWHAENTGRAHCRRWRNPGNLEERLRRAERAAQRGSWENA